MTATERTLTSTAIVALLIALTLAGCRSKYAAALDGRIVWDKEGCAYTIRPGAGDMSSVERMKDADRGECHEHQ